MDERLALEYAETMTITEPGLNDGLRQRLKAKFSEDTLAELTGLIAFQNLSSKFNSAPRGAAAGILSHPTKRAL